MEEKFLIKSEQYDVKKASIILIIIGLIISIGMIVWCISLSGEDYTFYYETYQIHQEDGDCGWFYESWEQCYCCEEIEDHPTRIGYSLNRVFGSINFFIVALPSLVFALIAVLVYFWLRSYEMIVTDKRIYGKGAWGKRVDLPVDSVSAISTIRILKGVTVATSSGKIKFLVIKNANAIYEVLNNLLIERQTKKNEAATVTASNADEAGQLKKYKDLLDSGVITQEEFDAKKKQLLGL